jgi:hypothetical protein
LAHFDFEAINHSWSTRLVPKPHYNIISVDVSGVVGCWFDDFPFFSKPFC